MHNVLPSARMPRAVAKGMASAGFALMLALTLAQSARAAGPSLTGDGLHISTGALVDPHGRTWISDHNAGFCRMTDATDEKPGTIEHPQQAGGTETRTCLGGLLPHAAVGPDAAGAPVFIDPTPQFEDSGDEIALVPDGAAPSDSVWKLHWNPNTRKFDSGEEIHMTADAGEDRPRPVAVSVGSDGNAYVVFQRSGTVQRIVDPASDTPTVQLVASTSDGRGASALAAVPGPLGPLGPPTIIVAEANGLTETPGTPDPNRNAVPSDYVAPTGVSAMAYREGNGLEGTGSLYIGTSDTVSPDAPLDRLLRFDAPGSAFAVEADGFTMIGGLAVRPDTNAVLVLDDPALVTEGEPIGLGRLFTVGSPYARIASGPSSKDGNTRIDPSHTANTQPVFTFTGDGDEQCAVVPAEEPLGGWQDCASPYTTPVLADDTYRFAVRSRLDGQTGRPDIRTFTVDTTAPAAAPTIVSPAEGAFTTNNPYLEFDPATGEDEYGYECKLDGAATWTRCEEGRQQLSSGPHTLIVRPVDGAGNVAAEVDGDGNPVTDPSVSLERKFTVGPDPDPGTDPVENTTPLTNPNSVASYAGGLHIASGIIEAPDGRLWVSDHNGGFCRIADPTVKAAGHIDHPATPGAPGPRTCLGGLMPEPREGADAAGQPAFVDPTPRKPGSGDEVVLVPDGATKQLALWRAQWNPATKRFDPLDQFLGATDPADPDDGPRPTAAATGIDPDGPTGPQSAPVYYITKSTSWVVRINNPASASPTWDVVGYADDAGRSRRAGESIAVATIGPEGAKQDVVYLGEAGGVTRLVPSATPLPVVNEDDVTGNPQLQQFIARPVTLPGVATNAGLAYDRARDQLYVGTATAEGPPIAPGTDRVHRFQVTNATSTGATHTPVGEPIGEFTMVGGIGLRADGRVLVVDDEALIDPVEPIGTGRLYQIGSPAARITSGPSNVAGQTATATGHTAERTPEFGIAGDGALECWVRPADSIDEPAFAPCEGDTFTPAGDLANGEHLMTVRVADPTVTADQPYDPTKLVPDTMRFTVDAAAPGQPDVTASGHPGQTSAAPWFTFTPSGESGDGFTYRCSLNDAAEAACEPGRTYPLVNGQSQLQSGANTLRVRAIDLAGNVSGQRAFTFNADTSVPTVTFSAPGARSNAANTVFEFNASESGVTYGCGLDGGAIVACPDGNPASNGIGRAEYANLAEGSHTLRVQARDARGNMGPVATRTVVVDRTAPGVQISPGSGGPFNSTIGVQLTPTGGSAGETVSYACTLDGQALSQCLSLMTLSNLAPGAHTFTARATDDLGNQGPLVEVVWNVGGALGAGSAPVAPAAPIGQVAGVTITSPTVAALRIASVIQAATLRAQGVPVTVRTTAGQTTVRIQVFQVTGGQTVRAAAAKAKRKLVATVFKTTKQAKTYRFQLKDGKLRRLKPGRYVVEVRAGKSRTRLGKAKSRTFTVRGR